MNKTEQFLASYETDLKFELQQICEDIERTKNQIADLESQIKKIRASIDTSYAVFVASQSADTEDTEISTFTSLIEDKKALLDTLNQRRQSIQSKVAEVQSLDDREEPHLSLDQTDLLAKMRLIYKLMPVDTHRAQEELSLLIRRLEQ